MSTIHGEAVQTAKGDSTGADSGTLLAEAKAALGEGGASQHASEGGAGGAFQHASGNHQKISLSYQQATAVTFDFDFYCNTPGAHHPCAFAADRARPLMAGARRDEGPEQTANGRDM